MKTNSKAIFLSIIIVLLINKVAIGQFQIYSEASIKFENGIRKSTQLTVNFKEKIFDLPKGSKLASDQNIPQRFSNLISFFSSLKIKYGDIIFIKQIPDAVWGDIWKTSLATNQQVKLKDMSQLFTISFSQFVPIDSIILALKNLDEVEYAHPPIQTIQLITPDDPSYGSQWNLPKINAPSAWDITRGSTSLEVGIIETDLPQRDHIDLAGKFTAGKGDTGPAGAHATVVAGVIGAMTNNDTGISSLGWNLKLNPYEYTSGVGGGTLPAKIQQAVAEGCRVINCSFMTGEVVEEPGCRTGPKECYVWESRNHESVADEISNALSLGVVVVAAAGNESVNLYNSNFLQFCDLECDFFPYTPYPANNPGVIAVSATDINNIFAGGQSYNYGNFIDVCAPGISILTTSTENTYTTVSGSSLAAPHVAALCGLILSINPSLLPDEVENIIYSTATDLEPTGKDDHFGYGLIDAQKALLETLDRLAAENKSVNQTATGQNNGRRLVKSGSNCHLVFASGGEIFYRKSTNSGTSWQTPVRITTGNGENDYPSLTLGYYSQILVTWQRKTGTNTHDIYFAISSNGVNWNQYAVHSSITSSNPLPVITYNSHNQRITITYYTSWGIKGKTTTNNSPPNETVWVSQDVMQYGSNSTIASCGTNSYNILACSVPLSNHIFYRYQNSDGSWATSPNISNIIPGATLNQDPVICGMPSDGSVHVAWKSYTYAGGDPTNPRVIYRKNSSATSTWNSQYWQVGSLYSGTPTLTALASNKIDLLYVNYYGSHNIYKSRYNGSTWSSPTFIATSSDYPSVSTGSSSAKYVYTNQSISSPWAITMGSEILQKEDAINPLDYYSRSIAWLDSSGAYLELRLHPVYLKLKDGTKQRIDIMPVDLDTVNFTLSNSWDFLSTIQFQIPANAEEIIFDYSISAEEIDKVLDESINILQPNFKLGNSNQVLANSSRSHTLSSGKLPESRYQVSLPVNRINTNQLLIAEIKLNGLKPKSATFASLGHIFDYTSLTNENQRQIEQFVEPVHIEELSIQNYPNPFNPVTVIKYSLPTDEKVAIKVYDMLGREIAVLVNEYKTAGEYSVNFDGSSLASGVYFYSFTAGKFSQTRKMILLR